MPKNLLSGFLVLTLLHEPAFAALTGGRVIGWGDNTAGAATGFPSTNPSKSMSVVKVGGKPLENIAAIAAGGNHALALTAQGTVVGWGFNAYGQTTGVSSDDTAVANGLVFLNGSLLSNVVAIAAGENYSLALKQDGTVVAWGQVVARGEVTSQPGVSNIVSIAGARRYDSALALTKDGTVMHLAGFTKMPPQLSNVIAIAAGGGDYWPPAALRRDGTVFVWSGEAAAEGPASPPIGLTNVVAIAEGHAHTLALKRDGTVIAWGFDGSEGIDSISSGPVRIGGGMLTNVTAISAGRNFSLALKRDGTVVAWGRNDWHQVEVPAELRGVVAIAAGKTFCLAITTNTIPSDSTK